MKVFRRHALQKGLGDWQQDSMLSQRSSAERAFVSRARLDFFPSSHGSRIGDIVLYWPWCRMAFSRLESSPSSATTVCFSSQERTVTGLSLLKATSGSFPGVMVTHCHQSCKAWLSKEITFEPSSTSMVKCSCFQNNYASSVYACSRNTFLTPLFWDLLARLHSLRTALRFVYSCLWRLTRLSERVVSFMSESGETHRWPSLVKLFRKSEKWQSDKGT